ncbi:MAG: hypothetical protein AB7I36_08255 [Rhodospirillaceae bacterium]
MVHLWRHTRGGMGGPGHLLEAGGLMDQSLLMMACFGIMSDTEARFRKECGET